MCLRCLYTRLTHFFHPSLMSEVPQDLIDQVSDLETRMTALEEKANTPATPEDIKAVADEVAKLQKEVEPPAAQ